MDLDAFILIGGRSSRLGTDKAFARLGGQPLAVRAADTVEAALSPGRITFMTRGETQYNSDQLSALGRPVISDMNPGFGAWSGIETALADARSEWAFVLACDLPFMAAELLMLLAGSANGETEAVVPRQPDGRLQPLCAFYHVGPARSVVKAVLNGQVSLPSLNAIFDDLKTRIVEPDEYAYLPNAEQLFLNMNTPADLAAAEDVCNPS